MGGYDKWRNTYRDFPDEDLPWELGKPRDVLVELVTKGVLKGGKALDLCCGAATNSLYLAENGFSVTGIDISPDAVAYAYGKAKEKGLTAEFMEGDFTDLPFGNGEFDLVLDIGCFHHVLFGDRRRFIDGVVRVLKEGGFYQLTCFSARNGPDWNHFTKDEINGLFSDRFTIVDMKEYENFEHDGVVRYFLTVLMVKAEKSKGGNKPAAVS